MIIKGYTRKKEHGFANKMSAEEKARKLAEMSSNAEWRDETRKNRVKKGREQDEKEEKEIKTNDHSYYRLDSTEGHDQTDSDWLKDFVNNELNSSP